MQLNYWSDNNEKEFQGVLRITHSINNLYKELLELEIKGQKNTEEYDKKINYLSMAIDIENKKYCQVNFTKEKRELWDSYIGRYHLNDDFLSNSESIIAQQYDLKDIRRIVCRINDRFLYDEEYVSSSIDKYLKTRGFKDNHREAMINNLTQSIENDFLNGYLYYLNQVQNQKEFKSLKEYFICSKYYLSFINKDIEQKLLASNFNINEKLFYSSKAIFDIMHIDSVYYQLLCGAYGFNMVMNNIYGMLVFKDLDYANNTFGSSALIMKCFVKAGLNFVDKDIFKEIKSNYEELINNQEYIKDHLNDNISIHLVDLCLNDYKKEDAKVLYVSLKQK